ncbi:MAG: tetratricopeptide repeat protein [Ruminiclostridium sp.]
MPFTLEEIMKCHEDNIVYFNMLKGYIHNNLVIPFVGAGMSYPIYPLWGDFLRKVAKKANFVEAEIDELFRKHSYEIIAQRLSKSMGDFWLKDNICIEYSKDKVDATLNSMSVALLPEVFEHMVVTTNFDTILEEVYKRAENNFERVISPMNTSSMSMDGILNNAHYLMMLHGDVLNRDQLVLTKSQYDKYYREYEFIQKTLTNLFSGKHILFLGCSLGADRTMRVLHETVLANEGISHFAFVQKPKEASEFRKRAKELSMYHIRPIWYPYGQHEAIKILLMHLSIIKKNKLFNIPYDQNPFFVTREDVFEDCKDMFYTMKVTLEQRKRIALCGLDGIGKTSIAVEYAHKYKNQYDYVLWINGKSPETISSDLYKITQLLESNSDGVLDEVLVISMVKQWLTKNKNWLLIIDDVSNIEDISCIEVKKTVITSEMEGHIIITTHSQETGFFYLKKVEPMSEELGGRFLLKRAKIEGTIKSIIAAELVASEMEGLPLALDYAAAYVERTECDFKEYINIYQEAKKMQLEERRKSETAYPESVAITFKLSFDKIKDSNFVAAKILLFCSFLDHNIPEEIFTESSRHLGLPFNSNNKLNAFNSAIAEIRKYSLLNRNINKKSLGMHKLVQAVLNDYIDRDSKANMIRHLIDAINNILVDPDYENWDKFERFVPQVTACDKVLKELDLYLYRASYLFNKIGYYLYTRSCFSQAKYFYSQSMLHLDKSNTIDNELNIDILNNKAELYEQQGLFSDGETTVNTAIELCKQIGLSDSLRASKSYNILGFILEFKEEYEHAEQCFINALEIRTKSLGEEDILVAEILNNLAKLDGKFGKYKEAEDYYRRSLSIRQKKLNKNHPDIAQTLSNLSTFYIDLGNFSKAIDYQEQALSMFIIAYSKDKLEEITGYEEQTPKIVINNYINGILMDITHYNIAIALTNLGICYSHIGNYNESDLILNKAIDIFEKTYGFEHPEMAKAYSALGKNFYDMGNYDYAEEYFVKANEIWRGRQNVIHIDWPFSLNNLASIYFLKNKFAEAENAYMQALKISEKIYGIKHILTGKIYMNLGLVNQTKGNSPEAIRYYKKALRIFKSIYGNEIHLDIALILFQLCGVYKDNNEPDKYKYLRNKYNTAKNLLIQKLGESLDISILQDI